MGCKTLVGIALLFSVLAARESTFAQSRQPVVEYAGLLANLDINPTDGRLELHDQTRFTAAFLPDGVDVQAVLYKVGKAEPIYSHPLSVQDFYSVFSQLTCRGLTTDFYFRNGGEYVLSIQADGDEMTRLPFSVEIQQSADEFDPVRVWFAKGPWDDWASVYVPLDNGDDSILELWIWRHLEKIQQRGSDVYRVEMKLNGDLVAESGTTHVGGQKYQEVRLPLRYPASKGGKPFRLKDMVAQDGGYEFVVLKNDRPESSFKLKVDGGQMLAHYRQSGSHQPRHEYLLPRFPGDDFQRNRAGNLFWMSRLAVAKSGPAAKDLDPTASVSESESEPEAGSGWDPLPTVNLDRPFELVLTDVETRNDTMLSAGDDIIVFGDGYPTGVKYLKVGEEDARAIPNGRTYSSRVFRTCGKKILLVRGKQALVFDTETDRTMPIPEPAVSLYDPRGGLHRANRVNASGNLVVVVNDVDKVRDKTIIKILDLSGDEPRIMPIRNADYTQRQISSVAVDAETGIVAISSREQKAIYVASVAALANQKKYDMSGFGGVGSNQIFIDGQRIVYADVDDKLRELDLAKGATRALTQEAFGRSGNSFIANANRVVVATSEHFGTRYEMAVAETGQKPNVIGGSGAEIEGTSGSLGWAGCAAIAPDGTVFIAGTPSGGVGVGEYLQVLTADSWVPLKVGNRPIGAIDVTCGHALLAFKHGSRSSPTKIGYATFGEIVKIPGHEPSGQLPSPVKAISHKKPMTEVDQSALERVRAIAKISAAIERLEQRLTKSLLRSGVSEDEAKRRSRLHGNKMREIQNLPQRPEYP